MIDDQRRAQTILVVRHEVLADEPVERRECAGRILRQVAQVADPLVREDDHLIEPLLVTSRQRA